MANELKYAPTPTFEEELGFNWRDFGKVLLSNWYWLALSVAIFLCIGVFSLLRTAPTYTRYTSLLIKDDQSNGGTSSLVKDFQNMGLVSSSTNINNEILTISAPVLMEEVARRLHLDVQLSVASQLHKEPLYNGSPIKLFFPQALDDDVFSFKMKLAGNHKVELWDFVTYDERGEEIKDEKHLTIQTGTMATTPVGTVIVQPTENWNDEPVDEVIFVKKYRLKSVAAHYSNNLSVSLSEKESTILNLELVDNSKKRADDILLMVIDVYNEQWLKDKNLIAESTFEFITDRLNTLSQELGDVDQQISDYKSSTLLPDIEAASELYLSQSAKNNDQIILLNNQLSVAQYIKEYLAESANKGKYLPSNTGIGSTGIETLIAEYNKNISTRNEILGNSSENTPVIQKLDQDLELQKNGIMQSLENHIDQLRSQIQNWQTTEARTNTKLATAPRQATQLASIGRQQKVKEALYIYLLQKREENELTKAFTAWNTRIIQPPSGSDAPSGPRKKMTLTIALLIGLFIPICILYLRESLNRTVRGRADLDSMQTPLLCEIPQLSTGKHFWQKNHRDAPQKIYVKENCRDLINESFRILRTKIDFFLNESGKGAKVIMLTSFNVGSGKSLISSNLVKVLSIKGKRVLGIDMDMRHCSLSAISGNPEEGLSSYLNGMVSDFHSIIKKDAIGTNADILPVGIIPPNPAELLLSDLLKEMFEQLRQEYDYIVLDCTPIDTVVDVDIVKQYADCTLFVIRSGVMNRNALKDVDDLFQKGSYKKMALVLNGARYVSSRYGNYRYGYSYGYGYHYYQNEKK